MRAARWRRRSQAASARPIPKGAAILLRRSCCQGFFSSAWHTGNDSDEGRGVDLSPSSRKRVSEKCSGQSSPTDIKSLIEFAKAFPAQVGASSELSASWFVIAAMQGGPAQAAATTSIAVLGWRYSVLRESASAALRELRRGPLDEYAASGLQLLNLKHHKIHSRG